jgi:hypothetical protein
VSLQPRLRPSASTRTWDRRLFFSFLLSHGSIPPFSCDNFSESSALISWGFQNLFFKNHPLFHPLFSKKHLTNQSKNAALRALDQKVHFLIGGDF